MTPQEAHAALARLVSVPTASDEIRRAWRALDAGLRGDADLPEEWARLGAKEASERAQRANPTRWSDLVNKGYAPPPDGHDANGRAWWHPATIDAFRRGDWVRLPASPPVRAEGAPPPVRGPGSTTAAWVEFARAKGVSVGPHDGRDEIHEACRKAGVLP